jgi:hypothetical protein
MQLRKPCHNFSGLLSHVVNIGLALSASVIGISRNSLERKIMTLRQLFIFFTRFVSFISGLCKFSPKSPRTLLYNIRDNALT